MRFLILFLFATILFGASEKPTVVIDLTKSDKNVSKTTKADTELAKSLTMEAQKLSSKSNYTAAIKKLKLGIEADPLYAPQYMTAGLIYKKMGKRIEAVKHLKIYLKLEPKSKNTSSVRKLINKLEH